MTRGLSFTVTTLSATPPADGHLALNDALPITGTTTLTNSPNTNEETEKQWS